MLRSLLLLLLTCVTPFIVADIFKEKTDLDSSNVDPKILFFAKGFIDKEVKNVTEGNSESHSSMILPYSPSVVRALNGLRYIETAYVTLNSFRNRYRHIVPNMYVDGFLINFPVPPPVYNTCPYRNSIVCNSASTYRTTDGSCNNLQRPYIGKSETPFSRLLPHVYDDGLNKPKLRGYGHMYLPNVRYISNMVFMTNTPVEDSTLTHMATMFGQFLNFDIQLVDTIADIDCCRIENQYKQFMLSYNSHSRTQQIQRTQMLQAITSICMPIGIPKVDSVFPPNYNCMPYSRSSNTPKLDCKLGSRQQRNLNTHFIDGSQIYGSNDAITAMLRTGVDGALKTTNTANGELLMQDFLNTANCLLPNPNTNKAYCFLGGDKRLNENPMATALNTLFVREHNRLAKELKAANPTWNDEKLFQEARKMVIAQIQHITYNEYLPLILGPSVRSANGLTSTGTGYTNTYTSSTSATVSNSFGMLMTMITATMTRNTFSVNSEVKPLKGNFFNPEIFYKGSDAVTSIMKGLLNDKAHLFDRHVVPALQSGYVEYLPGFYRDLVAIMLQRSRDHGLPLYVDWLKLCSGAFVNPMTLPNHNLEARNKLLFTYKNVYNIDMLAGILTESVLPGNKVGPTAACILGKQFHALKYGDRFWYENSGPGQLTLQQLAEVRKTTLAHIICRNTAITQLQQLVFLPASSTNPTVSCTDLVNKVTTTTTQTTTQTTTPTTTQATPPTTQTTPTTTEFDGWGPFSSWSVCINGVQSRYRICTVGASKTATQCVGNPIETRFCSSSLTSLTNPAYLDKINNELINRTNTLRNEGKLTEKMFNMILMDIILDL